MQKFKTFCNKNQKLEFNLQFKVNISDLLKFKILKVVKNSIFLKTSKIKNFLILKFLNHTKLKRIQKSLFFLNLKLKFNYLKEYLMKLFKLHTQNRNFQLN